MYISKRTGALFISLFVIILLLINLGTHDERSPDPRASPIANSKANLAEHLAVGEESQPPSNRLLQEPVHKMELEEHLPAHTLWSIKNVGQLWEELAQPENVI